MSEPDFDPAIQKSYRVTPEFADSALFDAEVEVRLENRWRWRRRILSLLGLATAFVIIRQFVKVRLDDLSTGGLTISKSEEVTQLKGYVASLSEQIGFDHIHLGVLSGPSLLMTFAAATTILLIVAAVHWSKAL